MQVQGGNYATLRVSASLDVELWVPHLPPPVQALDWMLKTNYHLYTHELWQGQ